MIKINSELKEKSSLHIDYVYHESEYIVISGWFRDKNIDSLVIEPQKDYGVAINGQDCDFDLITFRRGDLEKEFLPYLFPACYGFTIKVEYHEEDIFNLELTNKNIKYSIDAFESYLITDIKLFSQQAISPMSDKIRNFLSDVVTANKKNAIKNSDEKIELSEQLKLLAIDWRLFASENNIPENEDPINFYIQNKYSTEFVIEDQFSTSYYKKAYPGVVENNLDPILHYYLWGKAEGRQGHEAPIKNDHLEELTSQIESSELDFQMEASDKDFYIDIHDQNADNEILVPFTSDIEAVEQSVDIETPEQHTEMVESKLAPSNEDAQEKSLLYRQLSSLDIDWAQFSSDNHILDSEDPIDFYIQHKDVQDFIVGDDLSTEFYNKTYPDITLHGVDLLLHYFTNGKQEGRLGSFQGLINTHYIGGKKEYNPLLPTIVIACHESSATGAPLVGLNLGLSICEEYNVIHIVLHESTLQDDFVDNSVFTLTHLRNKEATIKILLEWLHEQFKLDSIICNSVETYSVLESASDLNIPVISLLHEFSEYTRPRGKITNTVINSDKVIVPARIIAESAYKEMKDYFGIKNKPNNMVVLPQGKLPFLPQNNGVNLSVEQLRAKFNISKTDKVIVGAGYVQTRKGVDLFVDAAAKIKKHYSKSCKFIWVGGGYDPEHDIGCSVWLQSQLQEFGLEGDFYFLNHQKSLDDILDLADVYLLTSRLDPFPNVVIDALQADLPVVCFDRTTGCAEFLLENKSNSAVVPFLDTTEMAKKAIGFLGAKKQNPNVNRRLVKNKLDFNKYVKSLISIIEESKAEIKKRNEIVKAIAESGLFNLSFYNKGDDNSAIEYYVKTSLKGIHSTSPMPGFSVGKWFEDNKPESIYTVPLYEQIKSNNPVATHNCLLVNGDCQSVSTKKIAVHLHLYYFDLAEHFATYFSCLPSGFDLFVTVCESDIEDKVQAAFSNIGANKVEVIEVENIGRDVAPFFISLRNKVYKQGYDIVGHFHSKKSNDVDQGTGDRWREYLLTNLIGSKETINDIFKPFEDDNIGLVFAEDCHNVDFGKNKTFSDTLCDAMNIEHLATATLFPLGTMFWAKPQALAPLFELDLESYLQKEPLPYDGSYMHASERLVSHVVSQSGYQLQTVYTEGTKW
ncbi:rhamnan synthesis F family protein [Psychromonas sp. SP041]|uniref:rhamnan synthesis F family protein n=1 Tax=Psychromonas sp. SP041 TaxID=1365007 RepID=UPI00040AD94E|nr:rhamnan synthesis F family protein [Psychromonas sp. SP041]